jgi:nitroreductase
MHDLEEAILDRRSTRLFLRDKPVPQVPALPDEFKHFRSDLGALLYGTMGVPRHDAEARRVAVLRNWEFFRAPLGAVVCMHRDLGFVDALGVGAFLQTFMLALTARGVGSCVQVSIAGYPDVIREQLGISEDMRILCGVSIGYADPDFPANALVVPRSLLEDNVVFLDS